MRRSRSWTEAEVALYHARQSAARTPAAGTLPLAEKAFLERIRALAKATGWQEYHTRDSRRSPAGFPDLVLARPVSASRAGRLIFAEGKTATGKVTEDQMVWLDLLRHTVAGVEVYLWRPADWDTIVAVLT